MKKKSVDISQLFDVKLPEPLPLPELPSLVPPNWIASEQPSETRPTSTSETTGSHRVLASRLLQELDANSANLPTGRVEQIRREFELGYLNGTAIDPQSVAELRDADRPSRPARKPSAARPRDRVVAPLHQTGDEQLFWWVR